MSFTVAPAIDSSGEPRRMLLRASGIVALAAFAVAACLFITPETGTSEAGINMSLPGSIGSLWGTDQPVSESEKVMLPPDTQFAKKLYSDGLGTDIHCQIVLAGAEKRSIHRPEICLPAQGWTVKSGEVVPIELSNGKTLEVMKLQVVRPVTLNNGETRELTTLFCYWFVGKDATTPHHLVRVLKTNFDILLHNTNHRWAYVITSAPVLQGFVSGGKDEPQTFAELRAFIADLAPRIMKNSVGKP
jgi:hypothetical protein